MLLKYLIAIYFIKDSQMSLTKYFAEKTVMTFEHYFIPLDVLKNKKVLTSVFVSSQSPNNLDDLKVISFNGKYPNSEAELSGYNMLKSISRGIITTDECLEERKFRMRKQLTGFTHDLLKFYYYGRKESDSLEDAPKKPHLILGNQIDHEFIRNTEFFQNDYAKFYMGKSEKLNEAIIENYPDIKNKNLQLVDGDHTKNLESAIDYFINKQKLESVFLDMDPSKSITSYFEKDQKPPIDLMLLSIYFGKKKYSGEKEFPSLKNLLKKFKILNVFKDPMMHTLEEGNKFFFIVLGK